MKTSEAVEKFKSKIQEKLNQHIDYGHTPDDCHDWHGPVHSKTGNPQIQVGGKDGYACIAVRKYIFQQLGNTDRKQVSKPLCGNKLCLNMNHYAIQLKLQLGVDA